MKKLLTIATLLMVFAVKLFSQDCNFKVNQKDDFSGAMIKQTDYKLLGLKLGISETDVAFKSSDSSYTLILRRSDSGPMVVGTTDKIVFKMDDGSSISIYPLSIYNSDVISISSFRLESIYGLTKDQMKKLSTNKIVKMRINYNQVYDDMDVKDSRATKVQEIANCILTK